MIKFTTLLTLVASLAVLTACTSDSGSSAADDQFEDNDDILNATPTLQQTDYVGRQFDDDWYLITVSPNALQVVATLTFSHSAGDIDLSLHDSSGTQLAISDSTTDNEIIDFTVANSGTYYLRVYWDNAGNSYTLNWDDVSTLADDIYEPNNTRLTAQPTVENTIYTGIQNDDDWYEIFVNTGVERVVIDLTFSHALGDIDVELLDSTGSFLAASTSVTDNENINFVVPGSGTYYIRVYFGDAGNSYDLTWDDIAP